MKAQPVPYSSVVGGGVMLLADDGHAIGQIMFLVHDRELLGGKLVQEDLAGRIVRMINEQSDPPNTEVKNHG